MWHEREQTRQPRSNPVAIVLHRRHLYSVPKRATSREHWVPTGRTLHLVDIENLMGGPFEGQGAILAACHNYRQLVGIGPHDHMVVACNGKLAVTVGLIWNQGQLMVGNGPDGADLALLHQLQDPDWIAARYDRVVVGSGDGIFSDPVSKLAQLGIAAGVVSRPRALAYLLAKAANFVIYLPDCPLKGVAA